MNELILQVNQEKILKIPKNKCISIEIHLNKSKHGKEWIQLGDKLYYFCVPRPKNIESDTNNYFKITEEQYNFIQEILNTL